MNYLPSNLRYLRNRKKLSQTELGKLLGRDHTTISGYESGKRTPSLSDINKMTEIFHISTHALINDDLSIYAPKQSELYIEYICNELSKMSIDDADFDNIERFIIAYAHLNENQRRAIINMAESMVK